MKSFLLILFSLAFAAAAIYAVNLLVPVPPSPQREIIILPFSQNQTFPAVTATHIFIEDISSRTVLYSLAASDPIYPASTTKMMTALVAANHFSSTASLSAHLSFKEGQRLGIKPGEQFQFDQLLYALLVYSANDVAEELANQYPGGRAAFVNQMNSTAAQMHLTGTHFQNPTGLDEPSHYSTAVDLARLAAIVMTHPKLARIVSTENAVISTTDYSRAYVLTNLNQLLSQVPGVKGVKTGFTDLAGQSLVTWVEREGHPVVITLLGSKDRFSDTTKIIDWVYSNHTWRLLYP